MKNETSKLLSGGNPQMPKGNGDATVQAYIAALPGWKHLVGAELDRMVSDIVPNVQKSVKWNTPFYGQQEDGWFLAFHCIAQYVKVAFLRGTELDPNPPVHSKTPGTRYFHIREGDAVDTLQLAEWISQAARLPGVRL